MSGDQSSSGGVPYIGSRISLISKTDIRYEGLLFNIDTRQSMVALQNVRSFGTEGRRPDHIPPSDTVLQYATFKASEIKDLHVCEAAAQPPLPSKQVSPPPPPPQSIAPPLPQSQPQPPLPKQPSAVPLPPLYNQPPPLPNAPRPPSPMSSQPAPPTNSTLLTPGAVSGSHGLPSRQTPSNTTDREQPQQRQNAPSAQQRHGHANHNVSPTQTNTRTIPGMGGHLLKRKERRVNSETGQPESALGREFDFAGGLGDFDKEMEFSKLTVDEARPVVKGSYQKSSFFDTISCDALDRLEGIGGRMKAHEERKLNTETFGAVGLNNRRSYRGGRGRSNYNNGGYRSGQNGQYEQQNTRNDNTQSNGNGNGGRGNRNNGYHRRGNRQNQPTPHVQNE